MIGQTRLQAQMLEQIKANKFPRFSILIGDKGSGRKTIIKNIARHLGEYQECGTDVESVREVVEKAYQQMTPVVYVFPDADAMSVAAKNALLKVTEEPPNNAYFVMTLVTTTNTLATVMSRAALFYMDAYTTDELLEYYAGKANGDEENIKKYCLVPGDVDLLCSYDIGEFNKFINKVIDNVEKVSGANSFKMGSKIALGVKKADESGYDLGLFWKAFRAECLSRLESDPLKYIAGINVTSKYMGELKVAGVNLQMCFDNWLLDLRKEWMEYAGDKT